MTENTFALALRVGESPVLTHLSIGSSVVAEQLGNAGYDGLIIDLQHGDIDLREATRMAQAISTTRAMPMARIASIDTGVIGRLLDSGFRAIVCPMVEGREECERFIDACRYAPLGSRSYGPLRPALYAGEDFGASGNRGVTTIAMIETRAGVDNLEDILGTPGLDAVYIGPSDLARTFGLAFAADWEDGPVHDAIVRISAEAHRRGIAVGMWCGTPAYAKIMLAGGLLDYVGLSTDMTMLAATATSNVADLRAARTAASPHPGSSPTSTTQERF